MNGPRIHCWTEPVDDMVVAVHAMVRYRKGVNLYGLSTFVLLERYDHAQQRQAADRLREVLRLDHLGYIPRIAHMDERVGVV